MSPTPIASESVYGQITPEDLNNKGSPYIVYGYRGVKPKQAIARIDFWITGFLILVILAGLGYFIWNIVLQKRKKNQQESSSSQEQNQTELLM